MNNDELPPSYESLSQNVYATTTVPNQRPTTGPAVTVAPRCNYIRVNNNPPQPTSAMASILPGLERQLKEMHWIVIVLVISLVLLLLCSFILLLP